MPSPPAEPEPIPAAPAPSRDESVVAACDAADCAYNRDRACTAGTVTIAFVGGKPVCATYSTRQAPPET